MKIEDTQFRCISDLVMVDGTNTKGGTVRWNKETKNGWADRTMRFTVGPDKTGNEHLLSLSNQTGSVYYDLQRDGVNKVLDDNFMTVLNDFYRHVGLGTVNSMVYGKNDIIIADVELTNTFKYATRIIGAINPENMEINFDQSILTNASRTQIDFIKKNQHFVNDHSFSFIGIDYPKFDTRGVFQFDSIGVINIRLPEIHDTIKSIVSKQINDALNQPPEYINFKQTGKRSLTFEGKIETDINDRSCLEVDRRSRITTTNTKIDTDFSGTYRDGKLSVQSKGFPLGSDAIESIRNDCENYLDMAKLKEPDKNRDMNIE